MISFMRQVLIRHRLPDKQRRVRFDLSTRGSIKPMEPFAKEDSVVAGEGPTSPFSKSLASLFDAILIANFSTF